MHTRRHDSRDSVVPSDGERLADLSHELRTPITLILGPIDAMLGARNLTDAQRRDLQVVRRNACTLLKHAHALLAMASPDGADDGLVYREVDVAALMADALGHFEAFATQRGIRSELELPAPVLAYVDPERVEQVALNLLSNAFEHTPPGGRVTLSAHRLDESCVISVEDSGPGVRPELREAIFERHRRGDRPAERGRGIGLAIVRDLVDRHGGTVAVEDGALGGARFVVELPVRAPGREVSVPPAPPRPTLEPAADEERATVLVVEDDGAMRRFVTESLAGELAVVTARDGQEGLERGSALRPDLIVTDVTMPRMSGDRMIYAMRARRELDGVPILVLSGRTDERLRTELLRDGAQDYLIKPFSAEELRARAKNLISVKRTRDLLRAELASQQQDIEELARAVTARSRELATAWEAMRTARDAAEAASRAKGRFLQLCSHELRTPLTSILLQLETLGASDPLTESQAERVRRVGLAARRLSSLIDSLLEHTRLDSERLPLSARAFDVRSLVEEVALELTARAEERGLALVVEDGTASITSDPALLRMVLLNLLDNAIKFTERGAVRMRVLTTDLGARIEVADTGPGIADDQRARIFDLFEHLEDLHHKHTPGLGLGLPLVERLVDALGGRVELRSELGVGSTFAVELPDRPGGG